MKVRISLSFKVLGLVLGTVVLVILFAAKIINSQFKSSIAEVMVKRNVAILDNVATTINDFSEREFYVLKTLKSVVETSLDSSYASNEQMYKSIVEDMCRNKTLAYAWISIDNKHISPDEINGRHLIKGVNSSYGTNIETSNIDADFDNLADPYYVVQSAEEPVITEPDFYLLDGTATKRHMKLSMAVPIMYNGSFVGAIGADIDLFALQRLVDSLNVVQGQNICIVTENNSIVVCPNREFIGESYVKYDTIGFANMSKALDNFVNRYTISNSKGNDSTYNSIVSIHPAGIGKQWNLLNNTSVDYINNRVADSLSFVTRVIIFGLFIFAIVTFIFSLTIVKPIKRVTEVIKKLALGQVNETLKTEVVSNDELGEMTDSSNKVVDGMLHVTKFAENIGNGNTEYNFTPLSDKDALGNAIIEMRNSLDRAKEEEKLRRVEEGQLNWASNGINIFNKILRVDNDNINVLAEEIIKNLTLYLNAQMGAFYIVPSDREGVELIAHIGFNKEKTYNTYIAPGDGLIGRAYLEKETIFISEIPDNMDKIGSGLGSSLPKSALIVPLIYNKKLAGILEIYSLKVLQQYQIAFVEKLSENIASTITTVKINGQTAILLEKSKKQAEVLEQQEEEIRQNMEEMQATQEESTQKEEELNNVIDGFNAIVPIVRYDVNRRVTDANDDFLKLVKLTKSKLIGKQHKADLFMDEQEQAKHNKFWDELLSGKIMETEEEFDDGKEPIWLLERFIPVYNSANMITDIIAVGIDITGQKQIEQQIQMVQEGIIPEQLKNSITGGKQVKVTQRLIDLTHLNVMYKNDFKKINTILKRYYEQIPEQMKDIEQSVVNRNYKVLKMEIKALKTKANYLGIKSIYDMADTIVNLITEDKDMTAIPRIFEQLKAKWSEAYTELAEIVKTEANY